MSLSLEALATEFNGTLSRTGDSPVGITMDSRSVEAGFMFACVSGSSFDGHDFVESAVKSGATSLLVEKQVDASVPTLLVESVRDCLGEISSLIYGRPSESIEVIGVTGTNGKSSVVQLLDDIFRADGRSSEVYGTLTGSRTTPEAPELQRKLAASADSGVSSVMMEVSSHSLTMRRVNGTRFKVAIFTNLSHDHLDFHGTMEDYFLAKAELFTEQFTNKAIVNLDDEYGKRLVDKVPTIGFRLSDAENLQIVGPVSKFTWRDQEIELHLIGTHNVMNALAAATAAEAIGIDRSVIADALSQSAPVAGRLEIVSQSHPFVVAVDYAHTPDALSAVCVAAREISDSGKVILVFGCGGDRDSAKRPEMGQIASEMTDLAILTTDNPRTEDPSQIMEDVLEGATQERPLKVISDRKEAIETAIASAEPGDVVIIAGKGHETGQYVGDQVFPFDDSEVARSALAVAQ